MRWIAGVPAIAGAILAGCALTPEVAPRVTPGELVSQRQWLVAVCVTDADDCVLASPSIVVTEGARAAVSVVEETPIVRDFDVVEIDGRVAARPVPGVLSPGLAFSTVVRGIDGRPGAAAVAFDVSWTWIEGPVPLRLVPGGDPAGPGVEIHMPSVGSTSARGALAMACGGDRTLARLAGENGAPLFVSVRVEELRKGGEPRDAESALRPAMPRRGASASREDPLGRGSGAGAAADAPANGRDVGNGRDSEDTGIDELTPLAGAAARDARPFVVSLTGCIDARAPSPRPLPCAGAPMTGRAERADRPYPGRPPEWTVEADTVQAPGVRLARTVTCIWLAEVTALGGFLDPVVASGSVGGEADWVRDGLVSVRGLGLTDPIFRTSLASGRPSAVESRAPVATELTAPVDDPESPDAVVEEWKTALNAIANAGSGMTASASPAWLPQVCVRPGCIAAASRAHPVDDAPLTPR